MLNSCESSYHILAIPAATVPAITSGHALALAGAFKDDYT